MTRTKMRELRQTMLQAFLHGWAISLIMISLASFSATSRADIIATSLLFNSGAFAATALIGIGPRSAGFSLGYLMTTLYIALLATLVPLPAAHP